MLPTIGVMIGFYIVVRMVQAILPEDPTWARIIVGTLAAVALVVAVLGIGDLMTSGSDASAQMEQIAPPNFDYLPEP